MSGPSAGPRARAGGRRALALSLGLNLALVLALAAALAGLVPGSGDDPAALRRALLADTELRGELAAELGAEVLGIHDSHNDPEVGRVLFAGLDKTSQRGEHVRANRQGMRERDYELPKPEGVTRVVLLGDSLVFGVKVQAHERLGAHLETRLREALADPALEVLSLGIASWNVWNECAYLRRQLGLLRPDVVVHVLTDNDLDDGLGVRGFGAMASFSPSARERGEARVAAATLFPDAGRVLAAPLLAGLDATSRGRRAAAQAAVEDLAGRLERVGASYLPLVYAAQDAALLRDALLPARWHGRALAVRRAFADDPATWVEPTDRHWGDGGGARLADALAAYLLRSGRLGTAGAEDATADGAARELDARIAAVLEPADELPPPAPWATFEALDAELDLGALDGVEGMHVYAGIARGGLAHPFVDVVLRPPEGATELVVVGRALERPELVDLRVALAVEGTPVGERALPASGPFELRFPLPEDLVGGPETLAAVALRFDDHVLTGGFLQVAASAWLERVRLE